MVLGSFDTIFKIPICSSAKRIRTTTPFANCQLAIRCACLMLLFPVMFEMTFTLHCWEETSPKYEMLKSRLRFAMNEEMPFQWVKKFTFSKKKLFFFSCQMNLCSLNCITDISSNQKLLSKDSKLLLPLKSLKKCGILSSQHLQYIFYLALFTPWVPGANLFELHSLMSKKLERCQNHFFYGAGSDKHRQREAPNWRVQISDLPQWAKVDGDVQSSTAHRRVSEGASQIPLQTQVTFFLILKI